MNPAIALELDYHLCDLLNITMDILDSYPLSEVVKMREIVEPMYKDLNPDLWVGISGE